MYRCDPTLRTPKHVMETLKTTVDMLEYSHSTSEQYYDYKKVADFLNDVKKYLKEVENDQQR